MRTYQLVVSESPHNSTGLAQVMIFNHTKNQAEIIAAYEWRMNPSHITVSDDMDDMDQMGCVISTMVRALNQWHQNECNCGHGIGVGPMDPSDCDCHSQDLPQL